MLAHDLIAGLRGAQEMRWVGVEEGEVLAPVCPPLLLGHVPSEAQGIEALAFLWS